MVGSPLVPCFFLLFVLRLAVSSLSWVTPLSRGTTPRPHTLTWTGVRMT